MFFIYLFLIYKKDGENIKRFIYKRIFPNGPFTFSLPLMFQDWNKLCVAGKI
jgi:hypothetical protein